MNRILGTLKQPWVVAPLVGLLVLGGWTIWRGSSDGGTTEQGTEQVIEAELASMSESFSGEGTAEYLQSEDLSFNASGTLTEVNVGAGDAVAEGDVLAVMSSPELEAAVARAEATLASAEASLADDTAAGESDAQLTADLASVSTAMQSLEAAEEELAATAITAPFDGTVAVVDLEVGDQLGSSGTSGVALSGSGTDSGVAAGGVGSSEGNTSLGVVAGADSSDSASDSPQLRVVTPGEFTVEVGLDAEEVAAVAVGAEVEVSLSSGSSDAGFGGGGFPGGGPPANGGSAGAPGARDLAGGANDSTDDDSGAPAARDDAETVTGVVSAVAEVADTSSGVATYPVTVEFRSDSGDFNDGATVLVEFTTGDPLEVVQVPVFAVSTDSGTSTVTVRTEAGDEVREVVTGESSGMMVEVAEGLEPGELVVVTRAGAPGGGGGSDQAQQGGGAGEAGQ
ncbi:MAG: biotin/lipoyl-binding protein [Microthrixaceae bacterium]|nr:biotin/lipoyl-binding protein [Microthrixaceae bacterium]MCO5317623.1 biotin/lipoyl-binding protein [Microthrixaceae bacterium]